MGMDGGRFSGQLDSLLEATGLLNSSEGVRGHLDSSISVASWSPSMRGANLSRNRSLSVSSVHGASLSNPNLSISHSVASGPSNASSSRLLQPGDYSQYASESISGQSLSAIDLSQTIGRSHPPPETDPSPPIVNSPPPPRPRKSSIRSSLPSIRGFRNAFSFSRSASTPTNGKGKSRSRSRERNDVSASSNASGSDLSSSPIRPPPLQRSATTPTLLTSTLPRASIDTIQPHLPVYQAFSTLHAPSPTSANHLPATASRFGFVGRNVRHSSDSTASHSTTHSTATPALGKMFGQQDIGSREAIQVPYVNGSRERVTTPSVEAEAVPAPHQGRMSPAYVGHGRMSPASGMTPGVIGITGLMRPPGLDPHVELDERSVRTESGYGFGGLRVGSDGIILSPIEDSPTERGDGDEEDDVRALLGDGTFEGEYESTIGHGSEKTQEMVGSAVLHDGNFVHSFPLPNSPNSLVRQSSSRAQPGGEGESDLPAVPLPVPSEPTSDDTAVTRERLRRPLDPDPHTSPSPVLRPPGLEDYQAPRNPNVEPAKTESGTSSIERGLLGELTKQLRRVMEQQSIMDLARMNSSASLQRRDPHTPSSVLRLESDPGTPMERPVDEWGRWNLEDLKGAVARMKDLIEEQERRSSGYLGHGSSLSKSSFSSVFTPPAAPQRPVQEPEIHGPPNSGRKESQSSSSATVPSTTLVTPTSANDSASYPFPPSSHLPAEESATLILSRQDRMGSLDYSNLDPGLIAMLSPNNITASPSTFISPKSEVEAETDAPPPPNPPSTAPTFTVNSMGDENPSVDPIVASTPMGPDVTIATVASDGFGTIRSDHSVEEILFQKRTRDQDFFTTASNSDVSYSVDESTLEPVDSSSPPQNQPFTHAPHTSTISATTSTTVSSKPDSRENVTSGPSPVRRSNRILSTILDSPVKSSPPKSPSSKLRKDRLPLPQFEGEKTYRSEGDITPGKASLRKLFSGRLAGSKNSPPDPPNHSQPRDLTYLGHGRRPSSRLGVDEFRRVVTVGTESPRGMSLDEPRFSRLSGRPSLEQHPPHVRPSLDLNLGPRTARVFAAAGVLDRTDNDLSNRSSVWRSASVLGYRRDGIEREFEYGNTSGVRSLASSPVPLPGMLGPGSSRLLHRGSDLRRDRAESEIWSRPQNHRPIMGRPEVSVTSSPSSVTPARTTISSSSSSVHPGTDIRAQNEAQQAALQAQRERHELEKEALLTALSEAKKEAKREKTEKEELRQELGEMSGYVEELETKLGEALAQMRWMEKEISILKSAVGVGSNRVPRRDDTSNNRELKVRSVQEISQTQGMVESRPSFDFHPAPATSTPNRASSVIVRREPPSPEDGDEKPLIAESPFNERRYGHHRMSSDASSLVVPRMNQSMTMLLQENTYGDGLDGASLYSANDGSPPPSPTLVLGKKIKRSSIPPPLPTSLLSPGTLLTDNAKQGTLHTPSRNRKRTSSAMEMSPTTTTADYSVAPGSPGSLVLRPEDERHLGDLTNFIGTEDI
ncbi:hypothetical protein FRC17_002661 [Serendipita sp. 399]|nr:hypothetical protein FRC17_002661 [Serendipita sp. 399]